MRRLFSSSAVFRGNGRAFLLLSFFVPLLVRALPEIIMGGNITGFDTISYYVPVTLRWARDGFGVFEFFAAAPLFYASLVQLSSVGISVALVLKVLPPVLHGFLGLVVYLYANKALGWSYKRSLLVSLLACLSFVALRISWDMLRSELGLIFLFTFLTFLHRNWEERPRKCYALLLPIAVLTVLAHQLAAVILFAVLFVLLFGKLSDRKYGESLHLALSSLPALVLFGLIVYSNSVVSSGFSVLSGLASDRVGWSSLFGFGSYSDALAKTVGFMVFCYAFFVPFVGVGIRKFRIKEMKVWFFLCLIAALLPIVVPSAFLWGYRWTLLLSFPLAFLAVDLFGRFSRRFWVGFGTVMVLLSSCFVLLPAGMAFPYFAAFPYYVPSSMLQNSVPLEDCDDVVNALSWAKDNVGQNGCLLAHDAFYGWALLFVDGDSVFSYGYGDPEAAARELSVQGRGDLFLIWWVSGEGWHGVASLPACFVTVFRSNDIAVYRYNAGV